MFVRKEPDSLITAMISIHGRREFGVDLPLSHRLDLEFDDVEVPDQADPVALWRASNRRRWREQNGLFDVPPTIEDAASIIRFAGQFDEGLLLCHCQGGMSRAPAAALICLSTWYGPGSETKCWKLVQRLRTAAVPHRGLVKFADELLNRSGALIGALEARSP